MYRWIRWFQTVTVSLSRGQDLSRFQKWRETDLGRNCMHESPSYGTALAASWCSRGQLSCQIPTEHAQIIQRLIARARGAGSEQKSGNPFIHDCWLTFSISSLTVSLASSSLYTSECSWDEPNMPTKHNHWSWVTPAIDVLELPIVHESYMPTYSERLTSLSKKFPKRLLFDSPSDEKARHKRGYMRCDSKKSVC